MSLLWVTAVKPSATGKLPQEEGLWWRLHHHGREFSRADAKSEPFHKPEYLWEDYDDDEMQHAREYFGSREGYSAYSSPHHVKQYADERGLMTHAGDVIAFHGKQVGTGHDDEPLVMPHHDKPFMRMPYHEFEKRLRRTPKPGESLDLDPDDGAEWFGGGF